MPSRISDYALIGDTHAAGLVASDGSLDWLALPRFDSAACFAALLGDERHGRWSIRPADGGRATRRYRDGSLVLESVFRTAEGEVAVIDFMPPVTGDAHDVVRIVEGRRGRVVVETEFAVRFGYGRSVPWLRDDDGAVRAIAGPDSVLLSAPVALERKGGTLHARFEVAEGERCPFVMTWQPSHLPPSDPVEAEDALGDTEGWWARWSERCAYRGRWQEPVLRSLITLKALTYAPTGGVIAAATTSLPEKLGGVRNWDYRLCWIRDATMALGALLAAGYTEEASAWRDWLLRAVAGAPEAMQMVYGPAGERHLPEIELPWLPGHRGSSPVRIGNDAAEQFQLDVYGEVMDTLHQARRAGIEPDPFAWGIQRQLLEFLESRWREPDEGIWEVRTERRHFTHSKVMAWVAFDRAVKSVEQLGLDGPVDDWRRVRAEIREEVLEHGFDRRRRTFTRSYGSDETDASLLMLPLVGFIGADDPRMAGTVAAIQRDLSEDGFLRRYRTGDRSADGLPPGEGTFLPCTFWLVNNLALAGRREEAIALFERLLALRNDVGLLAEEHDPAGGEALGNFPQALTHLSLINSALALDPVGADPERERRET